jgi:hypothetical protein
VLYTWLNGTNELNQANQTRSIVCIIGLTWMDTGRYISIYIELSMDPHKYADGSQTIYRI